MPQVFRDLINEKVIEKGGWINAHAHADRAFIMTPEKLVVYQTANLEKKWDIIDEVKKTSTEDIYYERISRVVELQISQGVKAFGTFIDIDPVAGDRAIKAALRVREMYKKDIEILFMNQTIKGVIEPEAREWFDRGSEMVDIIGGLPGRDERDYGKGLEAFDILCETAKKYNKMLHVHVDQFNTPTEIETETLARKTIEYGLQGKTVAVHGISIAAHQKAYREDLYALMKEAKLMSISCPYAWIDSQRREDLLPVHNSLTPVDEMIPNGLVVAIGSDNICDYMVPLSSGVLWDDLKLLAAGTRFLQIDSLVDIASINGRKVLGLANYED